VEGAPRAALLDNAQDDAFQIAKNFVGGNPHRRETEAINDNIPCGVALRVVTAVVYLAVYLYREPCLQAREVERETSLRTLPPKLEPVRTRPQRRPEERLGRAHLPPQPTRALHRLDRCPQYARAPSTALRAVPLPVPGRSEGHRRLCISAVRSQVQTISSRWLSRRCSNVTIPASGRELESLRAITSVSARSVSPMNTGLGIRTLS
jgi:hypothetical protein